jgi:Mce-associated membrane protein
MTTDENSPNGDQGSAAEESTRPTRRLSWRRLTLAGLTVIAVALAAGVFYFLYRPDRQTDEAAAEAARKAAEDGAVALLSYSPDNLDSAIANAKSHLTGDFLTYYTDFTQQIASSAARDKQITSTADVADAAVSALKPDSAVVLLFVNKQSWSKDNPQPVAASATVRVELKKVDGSWLIAKFEPL